VGTECPAQERATQHRGFSRIAAGKPIFCVLGLPTKALSRTAERQKRSILQGLTSLGILSQQTHKMQLNNASPKRPSEMPASASNASENTKARDKGTKQNSDSDSQVHTQPTQGHNSDTTERQEQGRNKRFWAQRRATSSSRHKDVTKPPHGTVNAGQHSGYSNSSIHTLD